MNQWLLKKIPMPQLNGTKSDTSKNSADEEMKLN